MAGIMLVHALMLAYSAKVHSPSIDEVGQVPSGLVIWQFGRYDFYAVNPPLMRAVASLPWYVADLGRIPAFLLPPAERVAGIRPEMSFGIAYGALAGSQVFNMYFWARLFCIPFSLLGIWGSWRLAADLFGSRAGVVAACLWAFSPMALGFGAVCVPDIATTALGLLFFIYFRRWMAAPSWKTFYVAALLMGLTLLTKFTWLVVFALVLPGYCIVCTPRQQLGRRINGLVGMSLVSLFILNLGYEFDGSLTPLGEYKFVSKPLSGGEHGGNRFRGTILERVPVPFPSQYVLGIDLQKRDFEVGMRCYLAGTWKNGGWWYYYLYATLIKTPLPYFVLTAIALLSFAWVPARLDWRDELLLFLPAIVTFVFVSSQTGFSHHQRYVFPAFPFWFVSISRVASPAFQTAVMRRLRIDMVCVVWAIIAGVASFPHNMWYFNELVGGSKNGDKHLLDSNSDWGQDLLFLREWLDEHPQVEDLSLCCFSLIDPQSAGIRFKLPPSGLYRPEKEAPPKPETIESLVQRWFLGQTEEGRDAPPLDQRISGGPRPGYFAIGASFLRGSHFPMADGSGGVFSSTDAHFTYFQMLEPIGRAGYTFRIYYISPKQARELREKLGWPVDE